MHSAYTMYKSICGHETNTYMYHTNAPGIQLIMFAHLSFCTQGKCLGKNLLFQRVQSIQYVIGMCLLRTEEQNREQLTNHTTTRIYHATALEICWLNVLRFFFFHGENKQKQLVCAVDAMCVRCFFFSKTFWAHNDGQFFI